MNGLVICYLQNGVGSHFIITPTKNATIIEMDDDVSAANVISLVGSNDINQI